MRLKGRVSWRGVDLQKRKITLALLFEDITLAIKRLGFCQCLNISRLLYDGRLRKKWNQRKLSNGNLPQLGD
jgi:hypothetical protein